MIMMTTILVAIIMIMMIRGSVLKVKNPRNLIKSWRGGGVVSEEEFVEPISTSQIEIGRLVTIMMMMAIQCNAM